MKGTRRVNELGKLARAVRNAVSHGNVHFSSDSRNPVDVKVKFWDVKESEWQGEIRADHLIEFCRRLMSALTTNWIL
jgi:hypothetical protein